MKPEVMTAIITVAVAIVSAAVSTNFTGFSVLERPVAFLPYLTFRT